MESVMKRRRILELHLAIPLAAVLSVIFLVGCKNTQNATAGKVEEQQFASPDAAGAALLAAATSENEQEIVSIFGPETKSVVLSGDAAKDKAAMQTFVKAYNQMHRWRAINAGGEILLTGADNRPFPIPLGKNAAGQWSFDTDAGKDEILARRIGNDELTAIEACRAIVDAQNQYFHESLAGGQTKEYAQKLVSDEGKQNGLYWPRADGAKPSPLGAVQDFALAAGGGNTSSDPQPFDGYYFAILTKGRSKSGASDYVVNGKMTGGFAVLAYPATYHDSGVMTFIAGKDGVVYEKDLGNKTAEAATIVTEFDPTDGWRPAI
jgi:Protein of unknown function (DUF2950)